MTPYLEAEGHKVLAPTMTGCGDRKHLISADVGLSTHIEDVVNSIQFAQADNIVLVGHSFAGLTITGVADRVRERIRHIIFFDALIPNENRLAAVSRDPDTGDWPEWWTDRVASFEEGYKMRFWGHYDTRMLVPAEDEKNTALLKKLLTWHPAKQWTEKLVLQNGGWEGLRRTCIHAAGQAYRPSSEAMIGPGRKLGWNFIELDVARNGFMTDPVRLAGALLSAI